MAGKLYPPYIDGKVPAFCGTALTVPFRHNRAVSQTQVRSMCCKIKTVSTNEWVWTIQIPEVNDDYIVYNKDTGQYAVIFNLGDNYLGRQDPDNPGQYKPYYQWLIEGLYYKIQLAYVDDISGQVGYFSDVGVTKYTSKPTVTIDGLNSYGVNNSLYNYVGVYSQLNGDTAERAYSYNFTIYDQADNVFLTSGDQIHNSSLDTEIYESRDEFYCNKELQANQIYKLKYTVTTINGLVAESQSYLIMRKDTVRPSINATLHAEVNYDDGYISLSLIPNDDNFYSGNFAIARSSSKDNFETWDEICKFSLNRESPLRNLFKDFTVEQGIRYCYSLQQYNTRGLYSNRMLSETLYADFEDMFLYDGERQLKIRFNPGVSSFKNNILESKQDTLGGRYPFIFRNGNVNYKEFPITGLISYLMDDQAYFLPKKDLGALEYEGTDLTSENIRAERMFKLAVMDWLNDGKAKLFRSPTEGNYVVRLLNISLSPNETVGRMLHSFSSTAYEVSDTSFSSLEEFGLFKAPNLETTIMRFKTIKLNTRAMAAWITNERETYLNTPPPIEEIKSHAGRTPALANVPQGYLGIFEGVAPDTIFGLRFVSTSGDEAIEYIRIGETQTYQINTGENMLAAIYPVWTPNIIKEKAIDRRFDGTFTIGYYTAAVTDNFSNISNFETEDRMTQFFGLHNNIIEELEDIRTSVGKLYWLKFQTRDIKDIYIDRETRKIYSDAYGQVCIRLEEILPTSVYADNSVSPVNYYSGYDILSANDNYFMGGDSLSIKYVLMPAAMIDNANYYWTNETTDIWGDSETPVNRLYKFSINHIDTNVDLETIGRYIITNLDNVSSISLGRMLMVDCYYQLVSKTYAIEDEDLDIQEARYDWATANELFYDAIRDETIAENTKETDPGREEWVRQQASVVNSLYQTYLTELRLKLNNQEG